MIDPIIARSVDLLILLMIGGRAPCQRLSRG